MAFSGPGVISDAQAGGLSIFETAKVRWLNVEEIITLLSTPGLIQQGTAAPSSPPVSGTLLLFDRSVVRNYKLDGHVWIKKRNNPNKVREDHVKLRYKGQYRVAGTYVHSVDVSTFHRRAYRLISDPNSTAPVAFLGEDIAPAENTELVLVHYLDTLEAVRVSALFADHLAAAATTSRRGGGRRKAAAGGAGGGAAMAFPQQIELQQQQLYQQQQQQQQQQAQYQAEQYQQHAYESHSHSQSLSSVQDSSSGGSYQPGQDPEADRLMAKLAMAKSDESDHRRGESLDEGALDILWDMVLEEGGDDIDQDLQEAAASAIEEHLTPGLEAQLVNTVEDAIQDVAASTLSEHLAAVSDDDIRDVVDQVLNEKSGGDGDNPFAEIESKVVATVEDVLPNSLQDKLVETMKEKLEDSKASSSRSRSRRDDDDEGEDMEEDGTPEMPPLPAFAAHVAPVAIDSSKPTVAKLMAENQPIPQTPLPEIIDFTPEDGPYRTSKPLKMVISTSSPLPILPPDDPPYRWHLIACFIDIGAQATFDNNNYAMAVPPAPDGTPAPQALPFSPDPLIMKVALTEVTKITPYSYKCYAPHDISKPSPRSIILTGVRYVDDEAGPIWDAIRVAIKVCIQAEWNVASDLTDPMRKVRLDAGEQDLIRPKFFAPAGSGNVQLLSQLSQDSFEFTEVPTVSALPNELKAAAGEEGTAERESRSMSNRSGELPAPAPALAVVAAALTQFESNPPANAVGENIPAANSRKRALTLDDGHTESLVQDANVSAANWAESVVPNSDGMTQGEDVNRHCKIRFVERLANVIVGTEDADAGADTSAAAASKDAGYTDPGLVLNVDGDTNFKDIGDEELDSLLHSVLIRFVEAMVDTSTSEDELKEALNQPGVSGFTLLHYAALYNILSLIPLLLSRGANPDALTEKGNLTSLHLAAGAGHDQIVAALVRAGCRVAPQDSYGLTPSDHALRCGFNEISEYLVDKAKQVDTTASPQRPPDENSVAAWTLEGLAAEKRENMQSAFKELSLKDKLGLNLFVQRYKRGDSVMSGDGGSDGAMQVIDEDNASTNDLNFNFISDKDRESLKTAMSMMSKDELDELEKNAPYSNVRDWMIKSNYESLRLASVQLEKQAKRRALSAAAGSGGSTQKSKDDSGGSNSSKKFGHSKLSQVLAMLVLRKNLLDTDGAQDQGQNQAQDGQQQQQQEEDGGGGAEMETR